MLNYLKRRSLENRLAVAKLEKEIAAVQNNYTLSSGSRGSEL